jgi:hypothetical protein
MSSHREVITEGLTHLAHVVKDCEYLSVLVRQVQLERHALYAMGAAQLAVVRAAAKMVPSLELVVRAGEEVFGEP